MANKKVDTATDETALVAFQQKYPALVNDVGAILRESLGANARLSLSDLPTVKVPAGGALNWELPTGESTKTLEGVLVSYQETRAFWNAEFSGGGSPPDCSSEDAVGGIGLFGKGSEANHTGECDGCPMAKWGSGKDNGQGCRLITRLFLLQEGSLVPTLVLLPPTGYKAARSYVRDRALLPPHRMTAVLTKIGLTKAQSDGGIAYSTVLFDPKPEALPGDVAMHMLTYRLQMEPILRGASPRAEALDVEHQREVE